MAPWRSTGSARVARAMAAVPRVGYLPHGQRGYAAQDRALPIGFDATCSQPSTVAAMLELLEVPAGASVLDVGSGSGWTTAILAHLVGPTGSVRGVEIVSELVDLAAERLRAADLPWASVALARASSSARTVARSPTPSSLSWSRGAGWSFLRLGGWCSWSWSTGRRGRHTPQVATPSSRCGDLSPGTGAGPVRWRSTRGAAGADTMVGGSGGPDFGACSSAGRAPRLHRGCRRFEPGRAHVLTVADVVRAIEALYPPQTADDWDRVGLIAGDPAAPVRRLHLAVDPTLAVVQEALAAGADLLFTHHPLKARLMCQLTTWSSAVLPHSD